MATSDLTGVRVKTGFFPLAYYLHLCTPRIEIDGCIHKKRWGTHFFALAPGTHKITDPAYSSNYCMDLGGECSLEPTAPFRYLNHSCAPNCSLVLMQIEYEDGTPSETELWLEANRDIYDGEELTIDYGWPADAAMPCNCGSPNCRGWIVAEELVDGIGQAQ